MSFDLTFFLPSAAPSNADEFEHWLESDDVAEAGNDANDWTGNDPSTLKSPLKIWYDEVRSKYPPLNGPDAPSDSEPEDPNTIDYCFSVDRVEVSITSSVSNAAIEDLLAAAGRNGLGVFDPQDGSVYLPDAAGTLQKRFELG